MWEERLKIYDHLVEKADIPRKGKSMIYTSANGHMFSILNKDGEIGFRFSEKTKKSFIEKYNTTDIKSYGSVMRGYILITEEMLKDEELVVEVLKESESYANSLPSK